MMQFSIVSQYLNWKFRRGVKGNKIVMKYSANLTRKKQLIYSIKSKGNDGQKS